MANSSAQQNYYSNPAFCQQSEHYPQQRCISPRRALSPERRQSPLGALKPQQTEVFYQPEVPPKIGPKPKNLQRKNSVKIVNTQPEYNEMLVDDNYTPTNRKLEDDNQRYLDASNGNIQYNNGNEELNYEDERVIMASRYEESRAPKHRYEYIPMQEQGYNPPSPKKQIQKKPLPQQEEDEIVHGRLHRYSVIPDDEEIEAPILKERYALVPVSEVPPNSRYAIIPSPEEHRYEYIPNQDYNQRRIATTIKSPQTPRKTSIIATQKLHELLTTPRKTPTQQRTPQNINSQRPSPQPTDPFCTPKNTPPKVTRVQSSKAQQKLNYTLSTRQNTQDNKRHTAVIAPICSSPVQSIYSETTFSNKTESWMNLSFQKPPQATLGVAAVMMILCGGLTSGLCFYMVSVVGRMYYLDFGIVSGFACLLLGLLGFRARNVHWLPNRNYISGYIVLSAFSLLTCAGLLVLLFLQPKPGSPLADVTSGAVCGISGLSLILASAGVIASYCCKYPPPDNRVQHAAQGFVV